MRTTLTCFILSLILSCQQILPRTLYGQAKGGLSLEWMFTGGPERVASVPCTSWLSDGRLLLYDTLVASGNRAMEMIDPATGSRTSAVDMPAALASLGSLLGPAETPALLPWPQSISSSGTKALFAFNGDIFILDLPTARFLRVTEGEDIGSSASLSPDGKLVAYVRENDLFVRELARKGERRLTFDGSPTRLNGRFSWVYWEEIFGHKEMAYWWSPDSRRLAFLQSDESAVSTMSFTDFQPYQPRVITQRYPKAGSATPRVRLGIVSATGGEVHWMKIPATSYEYLTGVTWLPIADSVAVQTMNRAQTRVDLYLVDGRTAEASHVLAETDSAWVHMYTPLFLKSKPELLWISDRSGYAHIYRYGLDGSLKNQITSGKWSLRPFGTRAIYEESPVLALDEKESRVYFCAGEHSSLERHLYSVSLTGGKPRRISESEGVHLAHFSPDGRYYVDATSNVRTPPELSLNKATGERIRTLSSPRQSALDGLSMRYPSFFSIAARDGFELPAQLSTPADFDSSKRYPVIMYVYGGPEAPSVSNEWNGNAWSESIYYDQLLLRAGYLVFSADNRSSASIGKVFEKSIQGQMYGDVELGDLVASVRWLKAQKYVDTNRVGIWGWSGGGMYTLLAMTRTKEFASGIAVAPVTDWHFYDAKWAEMPMKRPVDNPEGYQKTSLLARAKDLHGRLLMAQGTYDDNVHPQNTQAFLNELISAGILVEVMIYPMRKHTIDDGPARIHLYRTMLDFWTRTIPSGVR
ncbi:MAG TPA: S9 family peptidase [Bacteroidota bacterium]|nr:S9 family peptidase [Bacteroidota bacterium]